MNYKLIYDVLIHKAQNRTKPDGYVESHHIVPKCLGGTDQKSNLVVLTAREHCLAHLLLAKIHNTRGLWTAVAMMTHSKKMTSKAYESAKVKQSEIMLKNKNFLGKNHNEKTRLKISNSHKGKIKTEEHRENIRKSRLGKPLSEETKKKLSEGSVGKKGNNFKSPIKATNILTGKVVIFEGAKAFEEAGFKNSKVYSCINGHRKTHKGHTFERIATWR